MADPRTVPYTDPASVLQDMQVLEPVEDGSWPVVILAHGTAQSRSALKGWATGIAATGAITYNLTWPSGAGPTPEAVENLACAVSAAVADAGRHGGDTSRVVFVGHSLGAGVGAPAVLGGAEHLEDCAVAAGEDTLPNGFVGYEGPYDLASVDYMNDRRAPDPPVDESADAYAAIGGNPDLVVRLLHGDAEDFAWYDVPLGVSEDFVDALAEAGYDAELTVVEGGSHVEIGHRGPVEPAVIATVSELLADL
ncbi:alpha/beta hydrolase [Demequina lignilytica]|uniref:Alpha/beta hydrolase n=1 Tax=Demequina lignilytica TaxID=3051663 RepID=A0AB35MLF2_9MICO|nr:hypothetical protein [Demequina sp. SYSU T0a273]MDN4484500.1 hypothetical protein [Demequina sp. SYSU T0a273]